MGTWRTGESRGMIEVVDPSLREEVVGNDRMLVDIKVERLCVVMTVLGLIFKDVQGGVQPE